ncbi:MAG: hypothetical protein ACUVQ7_01500 [bacterium]
MRRSVWLISLALIPLLVLSVDAAKQGKQGSFDRTEPKVRPMIIDNTSFFDANNIKMIVTNHGSFAYDLTTQNAGLWYPKGTDKTCVYASGIWIGCKIGGEVHVTAGSFTQEYNPGVIREGCSWDPVGDPVHKVYRITRGDQTSYDYVNWPRDLGAPVDAEGNPLLIGDQTLWCVYHDADPSSHQSDEGRTPPMGIEIQQTTFGFDWLGPLGNVVFVRFKIINKCSNRMDSTFVSIWCDPDVGGASDDYVGCDTTLSVGFAYNATNSDNIYGSTPPCVGYDFFKGPIGDSGEELPMTSFNKYINGTDPRTFTESWNYMRGLDRDGSVLIDPTTGQPTKFFVPGDPVAGTGWLDSDPADRRFMLNSGPFTMMPGDTQEVVIGIIVAQGKDRLSSVRIMKYYDQVAQAAFDVDFNLPEPPKRPVVSVAELDGKIILSWGTDSEAQTSPGYFFEGYNIYQSASVSAAGPWKRIATIDLANGIGTIEDVVLNEEFGVPLLQPVQFGMDTGIKRYIEITEDKVRGVPLRNGTPYYYRVSAYSYNPEPPEGLPKTLERFSTIIKAIPQEPTADAVIFDKLARNRIIQGRKNESIPPTTDYVTVDIINPYELTGHKYRIEFKRFDIPDTIISDGEITLFNYKWNIKDLDTEKYLLTEWSKNKTGDDNYEVTDGFLAKVIGSYAEDILDRADFLDPQEEISDLLTGVDAGGMPVNGVGGGGIFYGIDFFGSELDPVQNADQFTTVEVRFSKTETQRAYRYIRPGYGFEGFVEVPFTVWDVVTGKQLNACFVEWTASAVFDSTWGPDDTEVGGREYLFIMRSEYDPNGGIYDDDNWGPGADVLYAAWLKMKEGYTASDIPDGSVLKFVWAKPGTDNDYFEFQPTEVRYSNEKAKSLLSKIRVIPNPYFAKSTYEMDQFHHVVKFSNLPRRCTIRIFNLAGDLIRTIEKTDPSTSIVEWDLMNEKEIPVASGFYIYHVDAPEIGSIYGKMAIFLEMERLNTF